MTDSMQSCLRRSSDETLTVGSSAVGTVASGPDWKEILSVFRLGSKTDAEMKKSGSLSQD